MRSESCPVYHPAAPQVAKHCINQLNTACEPGGITSILHTLTLLKDIIHQLPKLYIKVCPGRRSILLIYVYVLWHHPISFDTDYLRGTLKYHGIKKCFGNIVLFTNVAWIVRVQAVRNNVTIAKKCTNYNCSLWLSTSRKRCATNSSLVDCYARGSLQSHSVSGNKL